MTGISHKEDIQMENKHMKRCSIPLASGEIQVETTMKYQCAPVRLAKIKNSDNKCW